MDAPQLALMDAKMKLAFDHAHFTIIVVPRRRHLSQQELPANCHTVAETQHAPRHVSDTQIAVPCTEQRPLKTLRRPVA